MVKKDSLTTLFLFAVVAYLLYQIMQPANETFADHSEEKHSHSESESEQKMMVSEVEMESSEEEATVETEESTEEVVEQPVQIVATKPESKPAVNDFAPAGGDLDVGAEISDAFKSSIKPNVSKESKKENKKWDTKELLPKTKNLSDDEKKWFANNLDLDGINVDDENLINTKRYFGVNTVGQTLRNGGRDIRGTVPNPRFNVSPWMNSTIEPDNNIRPFCGAPQN